MGLLHYTFGNLTKEMGFCTRYSFGNLTKGMGAEQVKGVPSVIGFPHCAGFRKGLCIGWGSNLGGWDLPITNGRLYRCTRPLCIMIC